MNRTQKTLAALVVPGLLAVGIAAGVAVAQGPTVYHDGGMDGQHMTDPAAMQQHMKEILGDEGYHEMLDSMGTHGAGMPMDMPDMDGMMAAMQACLGEDGTMPMSPAVMPAGGHASHHADTGN